MSCVTKQLGTIDPSLFLRLDLLEKQVKDLTEQLRILTKGKKRGPKPKVSTKISDIVYMGDDKYKIKTDKTNEMVIVLSELMLTNIIDHLKENSLYELKNFTTVT